MNWAEAHRTAMLAAVHAHRDYEIDSSSRVDVFEAIEKAGVLLAFEPFPRLAGMYFAPPEYSPAIVVNSQHPLARQRYTAAHELGHHYLAHGTSIDPEMEPLYRWGGGDFPDVEKVAEAFAAWFLMPEQLVRKELAELGIEGPQTPEDVYALSLRLGTSYRATARHLQNLRLANRVAVDEWVRISPREIKQALSGNAPPADWRNDVWVIDESDESSSFNVRSGDRVILSLPEIPSSGITWEVAHCPDGLHYTANSYERELDLRLLQSDDSPHPELVGAETRRVFIFEAVFGSESPGSLDLVLGQPWDRKESDRIFKIFVKVEPPRLGVPERMLVLAA